MHAVLDSEVQLLREKSVANNTRFINEYLIRRHIDQDDFMEVRYKKKKENSCLSFINKNLII